MCFHVQNAHPRIEQLNRGLQIQAWAQVKRQVLHLQCFHVQNAHPRIEQMNWGLQVQAWAQVKRQVLHLYVFSRAEHPSSY